jgi:hypothetical protein
MIFYLIQNCFSIGYSEDTVRTLSASDSPSVSVLNYASKGRGAARIPNTKPKVYAGSANAPHPSYAPPPPMAWQQNHQQQQQNYHHQQQQQQQQQNYQRHGYGQSYQQNSNVNDMRNVSDVMDMMAQTSMFDNQ